MSIWQHADRLKDEGAVKVAATFSSCPFCRDALELLRNEKEDRGRSGEYETSTEQFYTCKLCGWWRCHRTHKHTDFGFRSFHASAAAAALRTLDLKDVNLPIGEVRDYLSAKFEQRFNVDARMLELVVASVFKDHGYAAEATAYSNDGGIDVILRGSANEQIGIQVKRYSDSIKVEQIRSFVGALLLKGYTKGIFVTTSRFQKGAYDAVNQARSIGLPIELMDAPKFLDALRVAQREAYRSSKELQSYVNPEAFVTLTNRFVRR